MEKEMKIISWEQFYFVHHRIVPTVKTVQFVSDRKPCIVLRGCWCDTVVVSVHEQSEEKSDNKNDSFVRK
jgi:hypothetical protein